MKKLQLIFILFLSFIIIGSAAECKTVKQLPKNALTYYDDISQFISKDRSSVEKVFGAGCVKGVGIKYKKFPKAVFYYDNQGQCYMISAPLKNFFKTQKRFGIISNEDFKDLTGFEPYTGKILNFDWFGYRGYLYILPKKNLHPNTVINVQIEHVYKLDNNI